MITQLLISSSSAKPIITASYVIVGGGGGAVFAGANGLGGAVINGEVIIPAGYYPVTIGAGGIQGGLGSSSTFNNLTANGSTTTTTTTISGEIFSGQDSGNPDSLVRGSGALASSMTPIMVCVKYRGSRCTQEAESGNYNNGVGNNGVVILTIPTELTSTISASGASISNNGSNTIYRFNSSGSLEVS